MKILPILLITVFFKQQAQEIAIAPAPSKEIVSLQVMCVESIVKNRLPGSELLPKYIGNDVIQADTQYREDMRAARVKILQLIDALPTPIEEGREEEITFCSPLSVEEGKRADDIEQLIWELIGNDASGSGEPTYMQRRLLCSVNDASCSCNLLYCLTKSYNLYLPIICPSIALSTYVTYILIGAIVPLNAGVVTAASFASVGLTGAIITALPLIKSDLPLLCAQRCYRCLLPDEIDLPPLVPEMTEDEIEDIDNEMFDEASILLQ